MLASLALTNPSGKVIEGYPERVETLNVSDRHYFQQIKKGANWALSDILTNKLDGKLAFIVAAAIRSSDGQLRGVVLTRVDEQRVRRLLFEQVPSSTRLILADSNGSIAFLNRRPSGQQKRLLLYAPALSASAVDGQSHQIGRINLPGEPDLTGAVVPVPNIGWTAGAFAPSGLIFLSVRNATIRDILVMAVIFAFAVIVGSLLIRQLTHSVDDLSVAAERLGDGKLDTRVSSPGVTEFATLAQTMNSMAGSIQQRDEALRQAYERERRISTAFQESMLPDVPAQVGRIELATAYFPALKEAELGGDFYDVMALPGGLVGLLVADVSGKGLQAAVHTATAKYALQGFAHEDPDPARSLDRLSAVLYDSPNNDKFITAFFAVVHPDTGRMLYANAGHPQPIVRHKDGSTQWLKIASGPPLGVSRQPNYIAHEISLIENDLLICYTDGVIEARRDSQWFGAEGLEEVTVTINSAPNEAVCEVYKVVSDFVGGQLPDDIALMAIRMSSVAFDGPLAGARRDCEPDRSNK